MLLWLTADCRGCPSNSGTWGKTDPKISFLRFEAVLSSEAHATDSVLYGLSIQCRQLVKLITHAVP